MSGLGRISHFDVTARATSASGKVAVQLAFGCLCALGMVAVRTALDVWAPYSGPFALVYPTVLIATLFGQALAGLTTLVLTFGWAWYFVLQPVESFSFSIPTDPSRVLINALCAAIIVGFSEIFRRAVREASATRDAEIARRKLLMIELEHRTKNNFALVASLLGIQQKTQNDPALVRAFEEARRRVETFAHAYENVGGIDGDDIDVDMEDYIRAIVDRVAYAAFPANVAIIVELEPCRLAQRKAVAIGLFVNEALTNCAKYAFPDGRDGSVNVRFRCLEDGHWELVVEDDGVGEALVHAEPNQAKGHSGIGQRLMSAFAQQADAELYIPDTTAGRHVCLASQ